MAAQVTATDDTTAAWENSADLLGRRGNKTTQRQYLHRGKIVTPTK